MDSAPKQQIVERVKQANNILVTVSNDPSVDQLASSIGLTLMLNAMGKHATAVFSGKIPSTLEFLQPEKTLESNTDSLRDFIISLDKSKADKLRYKVEDQVVRIFITPYRTKISETDLIFSQGDFNVEVVIALGVKERVHIDNAISAHGRILHDATVLSLNFGEPGENNDVGSVNWQEPTASSLSEMVVSISEAFGSGLIDNQMATAFLTGIVAETERFSNLKTTPKVMTMSAQLMAAGANQQLIASKLAEEVIAPVRAMSNGEEITQDQSNNDEIRIDHNEEINIDEHGHLDIPVEPEPTPEPQPEEHFESNPEEQAPQPESESQEESQPEPELNLPVPELEYEPDIQKDKRGELPDRLPIGDHQEPVKEEPQNFAFNSAHKVIQPLPHEELKSDTPNKDEPESKIINGRTILESDNEPGSHNPFTANAQPAYEGNPGAQFNQIHDPGLLQHSKPAANTQKPQEESAPPTQPPVVDKVLEDIQKELHQSSVGPNMNSTEQARQAVEEVKNNIPYDEDHPKPVVSLNANPVDFDQLHNPAEVQPDMPTPPMQPPVPEPFKMPELAITPPEPLTNLPDTLESASASSQASKSPMADEGADIPAISVSPDGTLRVTGVTQPNNDTMAPPAPPPVPPPIIPPSA